MDTRTDILNADQISVGLTTALTFDDVLLVPRHSNVLPSEVDVSSNFTRHIRLHVPIASAAMDTVTESRLAIAMAQQGGMGVIHKNLTVDEQASEVDRVKRSESRMMVNLIASSPINRIFEALELMKKYRISGVPITQDGSKEGRLVGILTNRDLRFEANLDRPISDIMTREPLFTVPVGTTLDAARDILHRHKVEKLLVVDDQYRLKGLITVKDIQKAIKYPNAAKDSLGRLRVGAAVGVAKDTVARAEALVAANVDVLVVDTAHGHSQGVLDMVHRLRRQFPKVDLEANPEDGEKLVPEGIEGRVAHKGSVAAMVHQLMGGLRAGMGYTGCANIPALQRDARMIRVSPAGLREGHVHDVIITKEAPNYRVE